MNRPSCRTTPDGPAHEDRAEDREAGQVAGIEVLPMALLVFVVGSLLLANAWAVIDAKMAASAAAREAARTYAELPADASATVGWARAEAAAGDAFAAYEVPAARTRVRPVGEPVALRCARIVVEARVDVPVISLPWIGGFGDGLSVRARHSELVDPYRSGLSGGTCA